MPQQRQFSPRHLLRLLPMFRPMQHPTLQTNTTNIQPNLLQQHTSKPRPLRYAFYNKTIQQARTNRLPSRPLPRQRQRRQRPPTKVPQLPLPICQHGKLHHTKRHPTRQQHKPRPRQTKRRRLPRTSSHPSQAKECLRQMRQITIILQNNKSHRSPNPRKL